MIQVRISGDNDSNTQYETLVPTSDAAMRIGYMIRSLHRQNGIIGHNQSYNSIKQCIVHFSASRVIAKSMPFDIYMIKGYVKRCTRGHIP